MAELSPAQRQMMVDALMGDSGRMPGSSPILPAGMGRTAAMRHPELAGLPPAVANAIAPNLGLNMGRQGDFLTNTAPPFGDAMLRDPMMDIQPPQLGSGMMSKPGEYFLPLPRMLRGI